MLLEIGTDSLWVRNDALYDSNACSFLLAEEQDELKLVRQDPQLTVVARGSGDSEQWENRMQRPKAHAGV